MEDRGKQRDQIHGEAKKWGEEESWEKRVGEKKVGRRVGEREESGREKRREG